MNRRVLFLASSSGHAIWDETSRLIPGFETLWFVEDSRPGRIPLLSVDTIRRLRAAARGADAVVAISALLGAGAAIAVRHIPVVAIDIGVARFIEIHGQLKGVPAASLLAVPDLVVALTQAHGRRLRLLRPGPKTVRVIRQPARPTGRLWSPDRERPYVLSAGSSGRDLAVVAEVARSVQFDIRVLEGGRELVPGRGRSQDRYPPNFIRYGRVERDHYLDLLSHASALVLSLPYTEYPIGLTTLLDAMITGVPIVATDVPSVIDYQTDGGAFLAPAGSVSAVLVALRAAVEHPELARRASETSRRHVQMIAGPDVVGRGFGRVLGEVLSNVRN